MSRIRFDDWTVLKIRYDYAALMEKHNDQSIALKKLADKYDTNRVIVFQIVTNQTYKYLL